jgi:transposase InsO family protein
LEKAHNHPASGHGGYAKTIARIIDRYYWPRLVEDTKHFVQTCDSCQRNKPIPKHPGLLKRMDIPTIPWTVISWDFITGLPEIDNENAIMVFQDLTSKVCRIVSTSDNITAQELAKLATREVFSKFGVPKGIISDRGSFFTSHFWKAFTDSLGIKRNLTTAYRPQGDGHTERLNQDVEKFLRAYIDYDQKNWKELLPMAEFAINSVIHTSLHMSPFEALYGFQPEWKTEEYETCNSPDAQKVIQDANIRFKLIETLLLHAQGEMIRYANKKQPQQREFDPGQLVLLDAEKITTNRPSKKLDHKAHGPFKIKKKLGNNVYELELPGQWKIYNKFNADRLVPYFEDPGRTPSNPPPELNEENKPYYEVEEILDAKNVNDKLFFLVRWKGYSKSEDTWEPEENMETCKDLVDDFMIKRFKESCRRSSEKGVMSETQTSRRRKDSHPKKRVRYSK